MNKPTSNVISRSNISPAIPKRVFVEVLSKLQRKRSELGWLLHQASDAKRCANIMAVVNVFSAFQLGPCGVNGLPLKLASTF